MTGRYSNPPEKYLKVIAPLVDMARNLLEKGEPLEPMAFVGNFASGKTMPMMLNNDSEAEKDRSAMAIRMAAEMLEADFVFLIMEVWSLPPDKISRMDAILEKYGSISASPYRVDTVSLCLETRYGVWVAECPALPKGISKKKRTIGPPRFKHFTEVEGRFSHFLRDADEAPGPTLH